MNSKKMVFAVFLGLLASAAALISALFMLLQLKTLSTMPAQVNNLKEAISAISTDIDVTPLSDRIDVIESSVKEIGDDVEAIKANQTVAVDNPSTSTEEPADNPTSTPGESTTEKPQDTEDTNKPEETTEDEPKSSKTTDRLNVRSQPGLKGSIVKTTTVGETLTLLGDKTIKDGFTWVKVRDSKGKTGWVAQRYTN